MNMIRKLSIIAMAVGFTTLTGCANLGFGNAEYKCTGIPEETDQGGVKCVSARKVYELTEQPGPVQIEPAVQERKKSSSGQDNRWWGADEDSAKREQAAVADVRVDSNNPLAASPINNDPVPIRSRAKIMRVWIAPWESTDGDLNVSGLVFTELEGRRWNIGTQEDIEAPSLSPLQSYQSTLEQRANQ